MLFSITGCPILKCVHLSGTSGYGEVILAFHANHHFNALPKLEYHCLDNSRVYYHQPPSSGYFCTCRWAPSSVACCGGDNLYIAVFDDMFSGLVAPSWCSFTCTCIRNNKKTFRQQTHYLQYRWSRKQENIWTWKKQKHGRREYQNEKFKVCRK